MRLFLIDGIGPFFRGHPPGRINWSKIPFGLIERDGMPDPARFTGIREDFRRVAAGAAAMGFNAITLDDVAHLAAHPDYPDGLRRRIAARQKSIKPGSPRPAGSCASSAIQRAAGMGASR